MRSALMMFLSVLALSANTACFHKLQARSIGENNQKPTVSITTTVASLAELPRCDQNTARVSAFVRDRGLYVQCRDFFWRDVKPGDTKGQYEAREPLRYNEWIDQATSMRWSLSKAEEISLADIQGDEHGAQSCLQGFKLPTEDQLQLASTNGLFQGLKARGGIAFDRAWTVDHKALTGIATGELQKVADSSSARAGVYCVASN